MKSESDFQTALGSLPDSDPIKKLVTGRNIFLSQLGLRNIKSVDGQAIYMEHWNGVAAPINIQDLVTADPVALAANKGRIKFFLTDEMRVSISIGQIKKLVDYGFFQIEGYTSY